MRVHSRRVLLPGLLVFVLALVAIGAAPPALADPAVRAVDAIGITVSDMERALEFYTRTLPFELVSDVQVSGRDYGRLNDLPFLNRRGNSTTPRLRVVRLRLGAEFLVLTDFLEPEGRPLPVDARSNDSWCQHIALVVSDMDRAYGLLREHKVQHVSPGPQTLLEGGAEAAGTRAFRFRDPDGHDLELLSFPPGTGDARWRSGGGALFLGIDHTAIVVRDIEASQAFYTRVLGFVEAGGGERSGTEQERLRSVFGARLHTTMLRAAAGPGIELVEYLAPPGGRPMPDDARANDLVHCETTLFVDDAEAVEKHLRSVEAHFISIGTVETPEAELGYERSFLVRDPDGHALHVVERAASGAATR